MKRDFATITRTGAVFLILAVGLVLAALPAQGQTHPANPAQVSAANIAPQPRARPVARVNGAVLTEVDLLREMYAIFPYAKQHNGTFPRTMEADIRGGALKMIEFEELVYQEANRRQMMIAPERLAKAEKQFEDHFASPQEFHAFLQAETNGSLPTLRTKIARSLLIEDFLKTEVTDKSLVSVTEARTFYSKNPERFKLPETYSLQTITVMSPVRPSPKQPNPPPATPEQLAQMRVRAEGALKQAKATKNYEAFGILAERISEDDYRVMMGDHRSVNTKDLPPAILRAVSKMQPGQISDVIQAEGAFTIIRLNFHTPPRMQSFAEVSKELRAQMRFNKQETLRRELDARLRKNAKVEEL
jgi:peptidyl-prolyl cis-trans isomerase SurA